MMKSMWKFSHFLLFYIFFLLFGAWIFYELNHVEEKKRHIAVNRQIQQFLYRNRQCLKEQDLYSYVDYFLDKSHTGLWDASLSNGNVSKWTFGQGLFFTTSLLTTVGYGTPTLITSYGKTLCILYTSIGLIFALIFQKILHRYCLPVIYQQIGQISHHPRLLRYGSKYRSYLFSFLFVSFIIVSSFMIVPTLILHHFYVRHWSLIELTYFAVTTNYLIGFGDLMPCADLHGQNRSRCATVLSVYVIVQVLTAGILSHMCWIYPRKQREHFQQRRHPSDPLSDSSHSLLLTVT